MAKRSKRYQKAAARIDRARRYPLDEAVRTLVAAEGAAKFDETVELAVKLGVDPRQADQNVRGTVVLPHGTGKSVRVLVFAKGDKAKEAEAAGADHVGLRLLGLVALGEHQHADALSGPVWQDDRAAHVLVRLAGIDPELHRQLDCLVELGRA